MSALLNEKVKVTMDRILHNMDTCASCPRKAKKWRWLPSGHTSPGQRRINVGATSWRCTDVDATLHLRHHVAPTLTRRCINIMCLQGMNRILHNINTCAWDPKKAKRWRCLRVCMKYASVQNHRGCFLSIDILLCTTCTHDYESAKLYINTSWKNVCCNL